MRRFAKDKPKHPKRVKTGGGRRPSDTATSVRAPLLTDVNSLTSQRQFMDKLLDTFNNRRTAVDARATLICTFSVALFGYLFTQPATLLGDTPSRGTIGMYVLLLLPSFASVVYSLSLVAPLRRATRERRADTRSLTWFYLIPRYSMDEYSVEVRNLSDRDILDLTIKQVHELSCLLQQRYRRLTLASQYLNVSLITIFVLFLMRAIITILKATS
jgi:hypothetical protein